jgi:hypothetical protein
MGSIVTPWNEWYDKQDLQVVKYDQVSWCHTFNNNGA